MQKKISILDITHQKNKKPIVCLTAYTASVAKILDKYCDMILVGDSVGMTIYGMDSTLKVTLDMMINHGKAVVNSTKKACIVIDMPFATYATPEQAYHNAAKILQKTGCDAVKLEGGKAIASTISFLTAHGIPAIGHIGLTPQHVKKIGYKCQGKDLDSYQSIIEDAKVIADSGASAVVLECIPETLAKEITGILQIPTIGIGASRFCDGQILVIDDILGLNNFNFRFVKQYVNLQEIIETAVKEYHSDVITKKFPEQKHSF